MEIKVTLESIRICKGNGYLEASPPATPPAEDAGRAPRAGLRGRQRARNDPHLAEDAGRAPRPVPRGMQRARNGPHLAEDAGQVRKGGSSLWEMLW